MAGASEPPSYTWGLSAKQGASAVSPAYGGVNVDQPLDASGGRSVANASAITAPTVETSADGALLVGAFGIGTNATITPPGGMTGQASASMTSGQNKVATHLADQLLGAAGSTGTRVAKASTAAPNIGQAIAFLPSTVEVPDDTEPPTQPMGLPLRLERRIRASFLWSRSEETLLLSEIGFDRDGEQIGGPVTSTSYSDTSVAPNTTYAYQVRAVDAVGNLSAPSNQASVTTPGAPPPPPEPHHVRGDRCEPHDDLGGSRFRGPVGTSPAMSSWHRLTWADTRRSRRLPIGRQSAQTWLTVSAPEASYWHLVDGQEPDLWTGPSPMPHRRRGSLPPPTAVSMEPARWLMPVRHQLRQVLLLSPHLS